MQAVILAAGMGKRLKGLTADKTKCMVEVNGITLIERALGHLNKFSLSRIIIVVGYESEKLIAFVKTIDLDTPILFVENPDYHSTNNIYSLFLARKFLKEEDTILIESDLIFEEAVLKRLVYAKSSTLALVAKYESWMDGTVVTLDEHNNITNFLSKSQFQYCNKNQYFKTVNMYKFSQEFSNSHYVPFLEAYCKALGNNEYYEQVLKVISLLEEPGIKAERLETETWYEIDDLQDLDIAESLFTETTEQKLIKISSRYGGYWRYPKMMDYCYLVNPYFPPERMLEEIKSNLDRLIIDYPSGQRVNSLLAANFFGVDQQAIVVGNGAAELIKIVISRTRGNIGIILPTFEEYAQRIPKDKIVPYETSMTNYHYNSEDIINFYQSKEISTLVMINPDNPSGNYVSNENMRSLVAWTKTKKIKLIVDESFIDFASSGGIDSLLQSNFLDVNQHLIVIKSISKSFGVPGIRLGVLASGNRALIAKLKKEVSIWNINSLGEFFLQIVEKYRIDYQNGMQTFKNTRSAFVDGLHAISYLRVFPSEANFVMCEVLRPYTASIIASSLLERSQILIKDLSHKNGIDGEFIRMAIKTDIENTILIEALQNIIT